MSACFADTYFFIALLFENDEAHAEAQARANSLSGRLYTTTWVLTEVADAMATPGRRERFLPFLQFLRSNPLATILPGDQARRVCTAHRSFSPPGVRVRLQVSEPCLYCRPDMAR